METISAEQYRANVGTLELAIRELSGYWTEEEKKERKTKILDDVNYWINKIRNTKTRSNNATKQANGTILWAKTQIANHYGVEL